MKSEYLGAIFGAADAAPSREVPEVAVMGRSNVGKSSLINMLLARKDMARVSKTPGRTQALHFYSAIPSAADLHEPAAKGAPAAKPVEPRPLVQPVCLVDLPGYGYAAVPDAIRRNWPRLVYGYLDVREELRVGLLLIDVRRDAREEEKALVARFQARALPLLIGVTKADQAPPTKRASAAQRIADQLGLSQKQTVLISTLEQRGRGQVWSRLLAAIAEHRGAPPSA